MSAATAEKTAEFTPTMLINIRHPEERVALTRVRKNEVGRMTRGITGESAQFINTQFLARTQEELDQVRAACPYVFIEPADESLPLFTDKKYGFSTRNLDAYNAWMNCEWRNAKEDSTG